MPDNWTREELRASVEAYLDMQRRIRAGVPVTKTEYYENLSSTYGRTEGAFEYRMQNISYVLSVLGRDWIPGLMPARNVGARVATELEAILAEAEQRPAEPDFAFQLKVKEKIARPTRQRPSGSRTPSSSTRSGKQYERDAAVAAWVLIESNGTCECCKRRAPFLSLDGIPFLEVHHVRRLADGGSDTVENAVALCPNCHRELHHGANRIPLLDSLYRIVERLVRE